LIKIEVMVNQGQDKRVIILLYHMIAVPMDSRERLYCVTPHRFKRQMEYLREAGYRFLSLDQLIEGPIIPVQKAVVLTFDDGYLDNFENALPVLEDLNIPATFFIVASLVGRSNAWMRREGYPERRLMDWPQLKEIASRPGFNIGSHTLTHPHLPLLQDGELEREVLGSRLLLEDRLGIEIRHFAYPYGEMDERVERVVGASHYESACSTRSGFTRPGSERFRLKRISVFGKDSSLSFRIKIVFGTNDGSPFLPLRYYLDRFRHHLRT